MNADGFSFSVMVGIGETYLPAFVLARGMGELAAALIATVPILLGAILQLAAPLILQRVRSYRRFVVATAALQACSMVMLVLMAMADHVPTWAVFVPATLYWAAGLATGPAWNTWVEQIVPRRIRPGFFARRSRLCHVGVLSGLILGGLLLRWSTTAGVPILIFAGLFGVGAMGRFISAAMLARQTEIRDKKAIRGSARYWQDTPQTDLRERFAAVWDGIRHPGAIGRFVLFLMAVQTAVYVSGPYFNPFMLKAMKMQWGEYMGLLSLGFIGKMLSLPWAARLANRAGADRLLWVGAIGIVPVSGLWMVSQETWFLACVQILSGLCWGCYELAMLLQFFRQIPSDRRVSILTLYNLGNSAAMVMGSLIGAAVLNGFGRTYEAYLAVFMASSLARAMALLLMPGGRVVIISTKTAVQGWVTRRVTVPTSGAISSLRQPLLRMSEPLPAEPAPTALVATISSVPMDSAPGETGVSPAEADGHQNSVPRVIRQRSAASEVVAVSAGHRIQGT
ncbi:MAG: MFS transporter [Planctomyces sp.]|nr:MFS transporter [Planctomyces sp.]